MCVTRNDIMLILIFVTTYHDGTGVSAAVSSGISVYVCPDSEVCYLSACVNCLCELSMDLRSTVTPQHSARTFLHLHFC